ncbi:MAG TPA: nucleotidyltransferase domain-containing protein [Eggerthellaceae bacterium]|nr:nucleotidyltransferase domain-containing protein [Eggerthellaceae bacterium]
MDTLNTKAIARAVAECAKPYPVREAYLFGSRARGDNDEASDIDLCIECNRGFTLFSLDSFARKLEAMLGRPVDIVCGEDSFYPRARERYLKDRLMVYTQS